MLLFGVSHSNLKGDVTILRTLKICNTPHDWNVKRINSRKALQLYSPATLRYHVFKVDNVIQKVFTISTRPLFYMFTVSDINYQVLLTKLLALCSLQMSITISSHPGLPVYTYLFQKRLFAITLFRDGSVIRYISSTFVFRDGVGPTLQVLRL